MNKEHNKKRLKDDQLFTSVRLQSWFTEGKERYWIVDERVDEGARQETDRHDSRSRRSSSSSTEPSYQEIKAAAEKWQEETKKKRLVLS